MKKTKILPNSYFVVKRASSGLGVFTKIDIPKGQYVLEYKGRLLNNDQADARGGRYLFEINSRWTIDGNNKRNIARFANHSCRPNCDTMDKNKRVYIIARRKIKAGEEITYDYGKDYFDYFIKPKGCRCEKCQDKGKARR